MNDQNDYRIRLGLNVRRRRHGMRLTQEELAAKLGCSSKTISAIERGKQNLSVSMLFGLGCVLDCPVKELLLGVE